MVDFVGNKIDEKEFLYNQLIEESEREREREKVPLLKFKMKKSELSVLTFTSY